VGVELQANVSKIMYQLADNVLPEWRVERLFFLVCSAVYGFPWHLMLSQELLLMLREYARVASIPPAEIRPTSIRVASGTKRRRRLFRGLNASKIIQFKPVLAARFRQGDGPGQFRSRSPARSFRPVTICTNHTPLRLLSCRCLTFATLGPPFSQFAWLIHRIDQKRQWP